MGRTSLPEAEAEAHETGVSGLADPDDAELLGLCSVVLSCGRVLMRHSQDGLQTGTTKALFHTSDFCRCFQYHGVSALDCINNKLFFAGWSCRYGLGVWKSTLAVDPRLIICRGGFLQVYSFS